MHVGTYGRLQDGNVRYLISCNKEEMEELLSAMSWLISEAGLDPDRVKMHDQIEKVLEQEP